MTEDQYASSPGNRTYCYTDLVVSFLAVAETIAIHCAFPRRDGQDGWYIRPKMVTHPSSNRAQRRAAVLNPWAADQKWAVTGNVVGRAEVLKQYKKVRQFYRAADIND